MRKLSFFSAVLILFLLLPASITWAQVTKTLNGTVRYESGMSETKFSTPNGDVKVNLPQSMSGKMLSGTVSTEPAGKTEKEKNRNLKELLKMSVMLDGQKIPVSATPTNFDWMTHMSGQSRTPMELLNASGAKVAEVSLPPVLAAPAVTPGAAPHLSTPSNVLVKGDALNIYTDQQFSSGEKLVLTDGKGQQFTVKPVCLSSNQAVVMVPGAASPGMCTVSGVFMGIDQISPVRFNLIDMELSSPNTNLRPGEQSFVQVLFEIKDFSFGFDDIYFFAIDLRNLNPNTVTMEGGNLQRVNVSAMILAGDNDELQPRRTIRRNITGNAVGSFSVRATLHEDYNTSNDPFRPQLNVLKTPEDFNAWANALKKDLKGYAAIQIKDESLVDLLQKDFIQSAIKANAQRAIDNMPNCISPEQLDESKAVAYSLLQPLHVPGGAASNWLSSYEASKVAAKTIDENLTGNTALIDYDVLKGGVEFTNRIGESVKDAALQAESKEVQQVIDQVQTNSETKENLQLLKDKMNTLAAHTDAKTGGYPEDPGFITRVPDGWSDGPPIQFEQKELKEPRKLDDKALQIGLHIGIKKLIADAAGARGQTWNTVCDNCRGCIEARMGEWAADLIKDLGVGIIKVYLDAAVGLIGDAVKAVGAAKEFFDKISDKVDNAEKLADDIANKIKKGELQVMALESKFCVKSEYCLTRGTIFYNPKTGCVFAIIYCEGTTLCCPNAQTIITMTYCTDEKGMASQVPDIDVIIK